MADVSKLNIKGTSYDLKDSTARGQLESLLPLKEKDKSRISFFKFEDITGATVPGFYNTAFSHNNESNWECVSEIIPCAEGDIFKVSGSINSFGSYDPNLVVYYDANKKFVGKCFGIIDSSITRYTDRIFVVPDGVAYIAFNSWISGSTTNCKLKVMKAVPIEGVYSQVENGLLEDRLTKNIYGKDLCVFGDNITDGAGSEGVSYAHLLRDKYAMNLTDNSVSGTTIAVRAGFNNSIYEKVIAMTGSCDIVILDGGTNDVTRIHRGELQLGSITSSYDPKDFDVSTTLGALEGICYFLNTQHFDAQKLFVFPNARIDGCIATTNKVFTRMKEVLEKWGFPYVDISKCNNLADWSPLLAGDYFLSESDRINPTLEAYKKFYLPPIEEALIHGITQYSGGSRFTELESIMALKYDSSNIETGSGNFNISSGIAGYIDSASFEYQKVGEWVDVHVYVAFKAFTPGSISISFNITGLPFTCKNIVTVREQCVTTAKRELIWAVQPNSSTLTVLLKDTTAFSSDEKLSFSIRYIIA